MARTVVICASPTFGKHDPGADGLIEQAGAQMVRVGRAEFERLDLDGLLPDTVGLVVGTERVEPALHAAAPRLRIIAKHGAGVDNIDVGAASAAGVVVTNAPGYNAMAVAEHTFALILAAARDIPRQDARVRDGGWGVSVGIELAGGTLGIVGMGAVGKLVARRARAFELRVIYSDVAVLDESLAAEFGATRVELPELLAASDVITLHTPLTPETKHLIGAEELALMRPSALIVNTARGGLIDDEALLAALEDGKLRGAALDVLGEEPPSTSLLAKTGRAVLTPHIAGYTEAALARTSRAVAEDVAAVLGGREPRHRLN